MLTFLSTTKAFRGLFQVIQTNAVTSWSTLVPPEQVILFGDDDGTGELCARLGLRHRPDVARNEHGTPLLSDMWVAGQELAATPVVCWSNADVIFTPALLEAARIVDAHPRPALLVGRRTDIGLTERLDFTDPRWLDHVVALADAQGELKPLNWIDYFVFPTGLFRELPAFAIGRPGYDQWLIWHARELGADVVDATAFVTAIHQRHDYSHAGNRRVVFQGPEAQANFAIVDDWRHFHSIANANLVLHADGTLASNRSMQHRLAVPKRHLAHALRFTRPLRQRVLGEQASWRARLRREGRSGQPSAR